MSKEQKPSACNCLNLRRASQAITKAYNEALVPCGITIGQYSILKHIGALSPVSVSRLAEAVRLDRTTLVRNLKLLEEMGLVVDAGQRTRDRQLCLTGSAVETLEEAEKLWQKAQDTVEAYLGAENLQMLTGLLNRIESRWG